ncbi:MAG TPA: hypothetical protein DCW72_07585 [Elusimicrobia bacterium]|nr:MAG: hypothetical protein A2X29_05695 [Elusimicrobia bacterium GWA2_64_40]OGR67025.1 MAG: hypothetical protein A2X30_06065 [Elusimicrobia bacterium GWB2_63_16]HAN03875.1 hypothetical protein [Elusimicrobiota bacterium]HAU90073.1 hypothetical protein [Elusimicrobiota bacterium]
MEAKNPFEGILTYGHYGRLWALSAAVILLQAGASLLALAAGRRWGFELNSFEAYIPALLATGLVSAAVLRGLGVSWRSALADWYRGFPRDAALALKYFGGYALMGLTLAAVLLALALLGGDGARTAMAPMSEQSAAEAVTLNGAVSASWLRALPALLAAFLLGPAVEELFFRRILYTAVRRRSGFWPAALLSGLVFALFHGASAPVILPVGVYFCWVYERERRLPVNIMLHALVNAVSVSLKALL